MSVSANDNHVECGGCGAEFQHFGVEPDATCPYCTLPYPLPTLDELIQQKGAPMADDNRTMREDRYGEPLADFYYDELNAMVPMNQDRGE